jgi:hypothetical protein
MNVTVSTRREHKGRCNQERNNEMNVFKLIEEHGLTLHGDIEHFAELVRADEREACARLVEADGLARGERGYMLIKAAARIRARGET